MTIHAQIITDSTQVIIRVPGKYSPDVLDDVKRRAMDMLKQTIAFQIQAGAIEAFDLEAEVPEIDTEVSDE